MLFHTSKQTYGHAHHSFAPPVGRSENLVKQNSVKEKSEQYGLP